MKIKSIKSSAKLDITAETAVPRMLRHGILIRSADRIILKTEAANPHKKGGKVLPQAYQSIDSSSQSGAEMSRGAAKASIRAYAEEPNTKAVICGANAVKKADRGSEIKSIVFASLDVAKLSLFVFFSAKHFEASGKKGTQNILKSPAGKRIIVSA